MRSVASGTLCLLLACIVVQNPGVSSMGSPGFHVRALILDTGHSIWSNICKGILNEMKYFLEHPGSPETSRSYMRSHFIEDLHNFFTELSGGLAEIPETSTGRSLSGYFMGTIVGSLRGFVGYWIEMFLSLKRGFVNVRTDHVREAAKFLRDAPSALVDWFMNPAKAFQEFLSQPVESRTRTFIDFFDNFANVKQKQIQNTKVLFASLMNVKVDMVQRMPNFYPLAMFPATTRFLGYDLYEERKFLMRNSRYFSGLPYTMYGLVQHHLLEKIADLDLGYKKDILTMFTHFLWSKAGLTRLYVNLVRECKTGNDKVPMTLLEGEDYNAADHIYLRYFIDLANRLRKEACQFYELDRKPGVPYDPADDYLFANNMMEILVESVYDRNVELFNNLIMVDYVAQTMLGNTTEKCFMYYLCAVGLVAARDKSDHGVTLLLAMLLDGQTSFEGFYNMDMVKRLGNPKMAKAMYLGYQEGHCNPYPGDPVICLNLDQFVFHPTQEPEMVTPDNLGIQETTSEAEP